MQHLWNGRAGRQVDALRHVVVPAPELRDAPALDGALPRDVRGAREPVLQRVRVLVRQRAGRERQSRRGVAHFHKGQKLKLKR